MVDIRTYSKEQVATEATNMLNAMLKQQGKTVDGIIEQVAQADNSMAKMFAGDKIAKLDSAISGAGLTKNGGYADVAKTQLEALKQGVIDAVHGASQAADKSLSGAALSADIAKKAEGLLDGNDKFKNALTFANGLAKIDNPNAPDIKISDVTAQIESGLQAHVPKQEVGKGKEAEKPTAVKETARAATPPAVTLVSDDGKGGAAAKPAASAAKPADAAAKKADAPAKPATPATSPALSASEQSKVKADAASDAAKKKEASDAQKPKNSFLDGLKQIPIIGMIITFIESMMEGDKKKDAPAALATGGGAPAGGGSGDVAVSQAPPAPAVTAPTQSKNDSVLPPVGTPNPPAKAAGGKTP